MNDAGPTIGHITGEAGRNAAGYRSYLLIHQGGEKFIASLIRTLGMAVSEAGIDSAGDDG